MVVNGHEISSGVDEQGVTHVIQKLFVASKFVFQISKPSDSRNYFAKR